MSVEVRVGNAPEDAPVAAGHATSTAETDREHVAGPPRTRQPLPPRWAGVRDWTCLTAAVAVVVGLIARPWNGGWRSPVVYGSDALSHLAMLDGAGITGTARGTTRLGAPYGLSWVDFPLGPDRMHLVLFRVLKLLSGDSFLALNLYLLLGFLLVAWASFGVLRALRISPLVAGAISVAFTLAPYHFARISDGHVFLASYFAVPLGVLLALRASDGTISRRMGRGAAAATVVGVAIVGSSSAYYAVFTMVLVGSLGLVVAVRRASWRVLLVPLVVSVAIGGVVAANAAGDVVSNARAGTNNEASVRPASDSQIFGLGLAQMILPDPQHRIPELGRIAGDTAEARGSGESGSAIGILALIGLLSIAVTCIRSVGSPGPVDATDSARRALSLRLGVLALSGVLVATVSSLGLLIAVLGFGQIRVWSRMSIVIAFIGLVGLALLLDRMIETATADRRRLVAWVVAAGVVAVALVDQTSSTSLPDRDQARDAQRVDREVASQMEAALPPDALVFELPQTDFLFAVPQGSMPLYGLLGPWASGSGSLRYSAAGMQGRGGDWQRSWVEQPPEVMIPGLAAAGFDAVYLDRRSEQGDGPGTAAADAWLRETLGEPSGVVADGSSSREWFDLRPLRAELDQEWGSRRVDRVGEAVRRPVGVVLGGAVDRFAVADGARLVTATSSITLRDESFGDGTTADGPLRVRFTLTGHEGSTVQVVSAGGSQEVVLGDGATPVELDLPPASESVVELTTDAPRLPGVAWRLGDVRLQVSQVQVIDAELDDLVAADGFRALE